jgi:uncharacterized OsmC-like protein
MPVTVRRVAGKQLEATVRGHTVRTDRPREDGGTDTGCTSGELLLMAMGSCATGSLRNFLEERGAPVGGLVAALAFEPSPTAGAPDRIVVAVKLPAGAAGVTDAEIAQAALAGRVVSRVRLGSEIEIRIERAGR